MKRRWTLLRVLVALVPAAGMAAGFSSAGGSEPMTAVIADFDNYDTAGEAPAQAAAHAARVERFAGLVQERLEAQGGYRVVPLACPASPCSAGAMAPEDLLRAARAAGARLLVYGGIHKMSTLIQMGKVQAIDLDSDRLLLDQSFSFRGDTDEAFRRAAGFVARYLDGAAPAP